MAVFVIPHVQVKSSAIESVGYSERYHGTLEIQFKSGRVTRFFIVPSHLFQGMISANSVGQYFNAYIKGRFRSKLVAIRPKAALKN